MQMKYFFNRLRLQRTLMQFQSQSHLTFEKRERKRGLGLGLEQGLELDNLLILKYVKNIFRKKIYVPKNRLQLLTLWLVEEGQEEDLRGQAV